MSLYKLFGIKQDSVLANLNKWHGQAFLNINTILFLMNILEQKIENFMMHLHYYNIYVIIIIILYYYYNINNYYIYIVYNSIIYNIVYNSIYIIIYIIYNINIIIINY